MDGRGTIKVPKGPRFTQAWPTGDQQRVSMFHRGGKPNMLVSHQRIKGYVSGDSSATTAPDLQLKTVMLGDVHGSRGGANLRLRGKGPGELVWNARKDPSVR